MTQTAHTDIRDAIVAALLTTPALANGKVVGNRHRPMAAQDNAQIYVYLDDSVADHTVIGQIYWTTQVRVEIVARSTSTASAADAADALAAAVHARLMADPSLGGKASDTEAAALAWADDEADTQISACRATFVVRHGTTTASITS